VGRAVGNRRAALSDGDSASSRGGLGDGGGIGGDHSRGADGKKSNESCGMHLEES
jgi:hypothetical protein